MITNLYTTSMGRSNFKFHQQQKSAVAYCKQKNVFTTMMFWVFWKAGQRRCFIFNVFNDNSVLAHFVISFHFSSALSAGFLFQTEIIFSLADGRKFMGKSNGNANGKFFCTDDARLKEILKLAVHGISCCNWNISQEFWNMKQKCFMFFKQIWFDKIKIDPINLKSINHQSSVN